MVAPSKLSQVFTYESWVHAVSGAAVSSNLVNGHTVKSLYIGKLNVFYYFFYRVAV